MSNASVIGRWFLLLIAILLLARDVLRIKRKERKLPSAIASVAVTVGLVVLLAVQFNFLSNYSETSMVISAVLILGGIAFDLGTTLRNKFKADTRNSSI